eukprot:1050389-Rhodomonas_salina.1
MKAVTTSPKEESLVLEGILVLLESDHDVGWVAEEAMSVWRWQERSHHSLPFRRPFVGNLPANAGNP